MRQALSTILEALFRVLFTYDCVGEENVPAAGPAVVAANHPSYLDPVLLSLQVPRPIRFMAWDALFKLPLLGLLLRLGGAFPVNIGRGQGGKAYLQAKALVEAGEVVGIFPEGKRSRSGWMEPALREGAARLSWETRAPLVPATITGAFRAWPYFRALPNPARVRVRYHEAIDPARYCEQTQEEGVQALLAELHRRVERTLMPGVKADLRMSALYRTAAPWPRLRESLPALGLALLVFFKTRSFAAVAPAYGYIGYLLLDLLFIPQRRISKRIRNASPVYFLLFYGSYALARLGRPSVPGAAALIAVVSGAFFPYLYERGRLTEGFIRGMVGAEVLSLGALWLAPTGLGPQVTLPIFAAAYAWEWRTVFWRAVVPVLLLYVVVVVRMLGGGTELLPHLVAALLAALVARQTRSPRRDQAAADRPSTLSLGLLDEPAARRDERE